MDATLNLPKTDFPMKANLPQREPAMLAWWEEQKLYDQIQDLGQGAASVCAA
jgi:isoleucyl-tRNA synthetase